MSLTRNLVSGDGRKLTVADIAQTYRNCVNISVPNKGKVQRLGDYAYSLLSHFSLHDCDTSERVETFKVYSMVTRKNGDSELIESVRCVSDAHKVSELASVTSDNGRFMARLNRASKASDPSAQLLEIWDRSKLLKTINISEIKTHGPIVTEDKFANFAWSKKGNQDKLLYVCQRNEPVEGSFFKETSGTQDDRVFGEAAHNQEKNFIRKETWGECLQDVNHTIIAVLDASNNCQISVIDVEGSSLAYPQWFDNDTKIVSVSYSEKPRRLGLIFCNNRPSKILVHSIESPSSEPIIELMNEKESFHTPRVNNSGDKFVFLSNPVFGPHFHSVRLNIYDLKSNTTTSPMSDSAGLFIDNLPTNCFTSNDKHILLVNSDHLYSHLSLFSIEDSKLTKIKFPTSGVSIMDFRHNIILASGSEPNTTPTMFVASLNASDVNDVVPWFQIEDCIHLDELESECFEIPTQDQSSFISALLMKPNLKSIQKGFVSDQESVLNTNNLPTVVVLHGGPHSAFKSCYLENVLFYVRLGLKVLLVNYRGSTGVTEDYVLSLCGRIGQLDIGDSLHAIRYFVQNKLIDPNRLVIQGGSHGGFIAAHLSCQKEFKFTSATLINPVIDLAALYSTSDIPDWALTEGLGHKNFDFSSNPDKNDRGRLYESSPISKSSEAYVPTIMLLGDQDLRVPMSQGMSWLNSLKARGVDTLCKVYPDTHQLPKHRADYLISSALWILEHL